jgi:hypothetical protein
VITDVKQLSPEVVQITRRHLPKRQLFGHVAFPNEDFEENHEVITIDRSKVNRRPQDVVLETQSHFGGLKHELTRLYGFGYMIKRQGLVPEAHNAFQDERALRLIRDVFMYKNMKECNSIYRVLDPHNSRAKASKENLRELSQSQIADLI